MTTESSSLSFSIAGAHPMEVGTFGSRATALEGFETLRWASQDCYDFLGHRVLVRSTSVEFGILVRRLFRSFPVHNGDDLAPDLNLSAVIAPAAEGAEPGRLHAMYRGGERVAETDSRWKLLRLLEWKIDAYLTEGVRDHLILHAGAVARGGAGILFPGPSRSGKSSLTMALLLQGYQYFSDEVGLVALSDGHLQAFPRPVTCRDVELFPDLEPRDDVWFGPVRTGSEGAEPAESGYSPVWYGHPEDVRPGSIADPTQINFVIFPTLEPGATPQLRPMSHGQAMKQLLKSAVNFPRLGEEGLHLLGRILEEARCYSLTANGIEATAKLVMDLVGVAAG